MNAGKGDARRKGEDNKKFRANWPKFENDFIPQWKKDLMKIKESGNEPSSIQ